MNESDLLSRIHEIYTSCTKKEQYYLRKILEELSLYGYSDTYNNIWLSDYKEIPVSIDRFISDDMYLGKSTRNGDAIYPYWKKVLDDIFSAGNKYEEVVFTGATRIGKSSTAITAAAYMTYRLMCLRDPQLFYNKKEVSKFFIFFFNITKDLAKGVAFREYNDTLSESPWFQSHGTTSKSERDFFYIPEGGKIVVDYGSEAAHGLGAQIYCLVGSTKVLTTDGLHSIESLSGSNVSLLQYDGSDIVKSEADVVLTKYVSDTVRIELEDGSVIEGTADHPVMLSNGTYKKLGDIQNSDDLLTLNKVEVDHMNFNENNFTVYKHTTPSGKVYVGITGLNVHQRWGSQGNGYCENKHFWSAINLYGWDNIVHEIVATGLSKYDACRLEEQLISEFRSYDPNFGYNQTYGGQHNLPNFETRLKLSQCSKEKWTRPEYREKMLNSLIGHPVSDETRKKISVANKGKLLGRPSKLRGRKLSSDHIEKLKGRTSWSKGLTKDTDDRLLKISKNLQGREFNDVWKENLSRSKKLLYQSGYSPIWINNGYIETLIDSKDALPDGYKLGRLNCGYRYIYLDNESKKVKSEDLSDYLDRGWKLGRGPAVQKSLQTAGQKFIWMYEGKIFNSADNLAQYLRSCGYEKIVGSTITSLYKKGFTQSKIYKDLEGKITRSSIS